MKTIGSTSVLFVTCVGFAALSLGFGSCDGASSSGGSEVGPDAGVTDGTSPRDAVAAADTSSVLDTGSVDTGAAPDAGPGEGGLCGEPHTTLGAACDGCIAQSCDPTWCACAADALDAGGDAGSGCLQYVSCVEACVQDDGGSPTDCLTTVCAVPPFTTPQEQAGHSFLDCLVQYCATDCGQ
jgi:hypothetical protein